MWPGCSAEHTHTSRAYSHRPTYFFFNQPDVLLHGQYLDVASGTSEIQKIDLILDHRAFLQRESVIGLTPGHVFFFFDRE